MAKKVKKADKTKKKPAVKAAKPAKKVAKAAPPKKAAKPVAAKKAAAAPKKSPVSVKAAAPKKGAEKVDKKKATLAAKAPATTKPHHPAKPIPEKVAKKGKAKGKAVEEVPEVPDTETAAAAAEEGEGSEEVVLTDAEGRRYCRVKDCDQLSAVDGYCRYHYLLYWKKIQVRKKILTEGKLERYVEELTSRYPDKFLDMLKKDLRSEKEFLAAIQELEIDESANENELEDETQTYIDEVRGMGETPAREDDGDF